MSSDESHNILAQINGELISKARQTLPPPGAGQRSEMQAEIDVPNIGRVRIKYRLNNSRRVKGSDWSWTAFFAEVVA